MAFSMESRLPFLDQELVDWVLRLPSSAHRRPGVEPGDPARRAARRAHREGAHPAVEGRLHHARDPLVARPARRGAGPVPLAAVLRASVLGRRRAGRHVRPLLRRRGGAVTDLLARRSTPRSGCGCSSSTTAGRGSERRPTRTSRASATSGSQPATSAPRRRSRSSPPHDQRHLFARSTVDGRDYARAPIRTRLFVSGDSLLDGLTDALRDVELEPGDVVADQREGGGHLPGTVVSGRRGARPPARPHAVAVRRSHRVGHRSRDPRHDGARHPGGGRGAHPHRHRGRRGHQAVRREGRVLPGGRSRGARHRRSHPRHHPALRRPRQDGSRRSRKASPGRWRRRWASASPSSTPTTSA